MDGRVAAIRAALDDAGLERTLLMSYSAKFHSGFYGPFRVAADSAPAADVALKDRATYQIDPARPTDALASSLRDAEEGADILMVKPGMPYLDVLADLSREIPLPWAVYEVSGEFAAIEVLAQQQLINAPGGASRSLDGAGSCRRQHDHYLRRAQRARMAEGMSETKKSAELFARARAVSPGGVHSPVRGFRGVGGTPRFITSARGCELTDVDGNRYVDFCMSWGPLIFGHQDAETAEAVRQALTRGWTFGTAEPYSLELAELITAQYSLGAEGALRQFRHRGGDGCTATGARGDRATQDPQVRRLLSRSCRFHAGARGLRTRGNGLARQRGCLVGGGWRNAGRAARRSRRRRADLRAAGLGHRRRDRRADSRQQRTAAAEAGVSAGAVSHRARGRRAGDLRRSDHRLSSRLRRHGRSRRSGAGSRHLRQGHRRRLPRRRLRRPRRSHGHGRAERAGVSGGHVERESGGDGRRARDAQEAPS